MKFALPLALLTATASANNGGHKHTAAAETMRKAFLTTLTVASNETAQKAVFNDGRDIEVKFTCVPAQGYPALARTVLNATGLLRGVPLTLAANQQAVALIHVTLRNPTNYATLANFGFGAGVALPATATEVLVSHNLGQGGFIGENFGTSLFRLDGTRYISFQPYSAWTHVVPNTRTCYFGARIEYTRRKNSEYAAADAEQVEEEGDDDYSAELEAISDEN